jgi:hypothetical protein
MPYITFMWYPRQDADAVFGIQDELRQFADEHDVGFYVNAREEDEERPVVLTDNVTLQERDLATLRLLAERANVTIYVHPPRA